MRNSHAIASLKGTISIGFMEILGGYVRHYMLQQQKGTSQWLLFCWIQVITAINHMFDDTLLMLFNARSQAD